MRAVGKVFSAAASVCALQFLAVSAFSQGTAFTFQGKLNANGAAANGSYDVAFTLFATNVTGTGIAGPVTNAAVGVTNGLFTTTVDFGAVFIGESNWLEIAVSTNGANAFSTLAPRQQLTPVPYALVAANVSGQVSLSQLPSSVVTNGASGVNISGTFSGNGSGVTNVPGTMPWQNPAGTTVTAAANQGYLLTNNGLTTVTLTTTANVGDVVTVSGLGTNGWQVIAGPEQDINGDFPAGIYWSDNNNAPSTNLWQSVASSADGSKLVAVVSGGLIYTSTDFGATWWATNNAPSTYWQCVASSADGTHLVAADYGGPIYTSTNSGVTWANNNNAPSANWFSLASSADGTHLVAGQYAGNIWTSTNSGVTWSANNNAPGDFFWFGLASSADGTHLVAVTGGSATNETIDSPIYTSTNSGVTWTNNNNAPTNGLWTCVASSADGTHLVAAESYKLGRVWTSTNSGITWTNNNNAPSNNWFSVASSADGTHLVAAANAGQIYISSNSGITWSANNNAPFAEWETVASSADGSRLVAIVNQGQIWTSGPTYSGTSGTTVQFQYVGNGVWQPAGVAGSQIIGTIAVSNLPPSVVTNGESGVTLSGTFSGNGSGLNSLNTSNLVGTLAATNFAATTVTNFAQVIGPLPTNFVFSSHGGRLLITAVGSGWSGGSGVIGMTVQLDGTVISTNQIYVNVGNFHLPFEVRTIVRNNVAAGSHTITLTALPGTTTDNNDFYSATVQELAY